MSKRVYVAAPWEDRKGAAVISNILEAAGFKITHKWWAWEGEEENASWEFKQECAALDVRGVRTADVVVLLNSKKSEGKATEQGLAMAYGIPIVVIGDKSKRCNIFQTLDCFHWLPATQTEVDGVPCLSYDKQQLFDLMNEVVNVSGE